MNKIPELNVYFGSRGYGKTNYELEQKVKELEGKIDVLEKYIYHIQKFIGNNIMSMINEEWENIDD